MGRRALPPGLKRVQLSVYPSPDLLTWVDEIAERFQLPRSKAMEWAFDVVRYAARELGPHESEVLELNGTVSGINLGRYARAEIERHKPLRLPVPAPKSRTER